MSPRTIYLDHATTSWPKPPGVGEAMTRYLREGAATPGRGAYASARDAGRQIDQLRDALASMIGAKSGERMVLTSGATESLNIAILGLFSGDRPGRELPAPPPRVVTTVLEHNSVRRPLAALQARGLIEVVEVGCDREGFVSAEAVLAAVDARTALVAMTGVSNVVGTMQPITEVGRGLRSAAAHARVLFLVDGSQGAGLVPIDVGASGIDLLAFSGHKALLGPPGTGVLYVSERAGVRVSPVRFGGSGGGGGGDSASSEMPGEMPHRFEAGTPNTVGFVGLLAALGEDAPARQDEVLAHERRLLGMMIEGLAAHERVRLIGPAGTDRRVGILSLTVLRYEPDEVSAILDGSFGISVRAGLHCAPGAHRALGTFEAGGGGGGSGTVRVSPGWATTPDDVGRFLEAMERLVKA